MALGRLKHCAMRLFAVRSMVMAGLCLIAQAGLFGLAGAPAAAQELRVGVQQLPRTLDPHQSDALHGYGAWISRHVFDRLFQRDASGAVAAGLLHDVAASDDARSWSFRVRRGVDFHNGAELRADDIIFSLRRFIEIQGKTPAWRIFDGAEISKLDDYEIRIDLSRPNGELPDYLASIAAVHRGDRSATGSAFGQSFTGTGPYLQAEFQPEVQLLLKGAHQTGRRHWRFSAGWPGLSFFQVRNPAARLAALRGGDLDLITQPPLSSFRQFRNSPEILTQAVPTGQLRYLFLDAGPENPALAAAGGGRNPFAERRVRQAVNLALDRRLLVEQYLEGSAQPSDQIGLPGTPWYNDDLPPLEADPSRAKRLLAEAGYGGGFTIDLPYIGGASGPSSNGAMAEFVATSLAAVGIQVKLKPLSRGRYAAATRDGTLGAGIRSAFAAPYGPATLFDRVANPRRIAGVKGRQSPPVLPELDDLIGKARGTADPQERAEMLRQAAALAREQASFVPLYHGSLTFAMQRAETGALLNAGAYILQMKDTPQVSPWSGLSRIDSAPNGEKSLTPEAETEASAEAEPEAAEAEPEAAAEAEPEAAEAEPEAAAEDGREDAAELTPEAAAAIEPGAAAEVVPGPEKISSLVWNVWAEAWGKDRRYKPAPELQPDTEYRLAIDLSGTSYAADQQGIYKTPAGETFAAESKKWRDEFTNETIELEAYILYDTAFFEPSRSSRQEQTDPLQYMEVDVEQLKKAYEQGITIPPQDSRLAVLKTKLENDETADFVFGEANFRLRTRANLPREGQAAVAFSIWTDDGRPIEEVVVGFCVTGRTCDQTAPVQFGLGGIDSLTASPGAGTGAPEAAIHLIQLRDNLVRGVFRENRSGQKPNIVAWTDRRAIRDIIEQTTDATASLLTVPRNDETTRLRKGGELYNTIFPPLDAKAARDAFEQFVLAHPSLFAGAFPDNPGILFVRTAIPSHPVANLLPFNMIALKSTDGKDFYLGHHFRIDSPMPRQSYRRHPVCIANWKMVQPARSAGNDPLQKAVGRLQSRVVLKNGKWKFRVDDSHQVDIFDNLNSFAPWIGGTPPEPDLAPTLVSILSHHSRTGIHFDQANPGSGIGYAGMVRNFPNPSALILNGCDTGNAGAENMIRSVGNYGIQAAITTSTGVPPELAGDFLECFAARAATITEADGQPLWRVYYDSLKCLHEKSSPKYGGQVLWYKYLGNANLRLCKPTG